MFHTQMHHIPSHEYQVLGDLLRAHLDAHQGQLRAMVAFGDLVATGTTYDIELLEVVDGWEGPTHYEFKSTADLPLRGLLSLYFLTPAQFEMPRKIEDLDLRSEVYALLTRVRQSYEPIYERHLGYVEKNLGSIESGAQPHHPPAKVNPFSLQSEDHS